VSSSPFDNAPSSESSYDIADCADDDGNGMTWLVNELPFPRARKRHIENWITKRFNRQIDCPFCKVRMFEYGKEPSMSNDHRLQSGVWIFPKPGNSPKPDYSVGYEFRLAVCMNCRYWQWHFRGLVDSGWPTGGWERWTCAISKLGTFNEPLPDGCRVELAQHMRRHPEQWHSASPKAMEKIVQAIFKGNFEDAEVLHVGGPHDGGKDVIFIDANGRKWLIQVKRRENSRAVENVTEVRNLLGVMAYEGVQHGIIASTADHFTVAAQKYAAGALSQGFVIELLDRGILNRMLGGLLPFDPWLAFLELHFNNVLQDHSFAEIKFENVAEAMSNRS